MDPRSDTNFTFTKGKEKPSLDPGAERLHYQFSAVLPQLQLTLVSVFQGVVFSTLLTNFPLLNINATWSIIFNDLLRQYFYLPYIISTLTIILIWNQFVQASLFVTWPLSIYQSTFIFLLTLAEVVAFEELNKGKLPEWLIGLGSVGIIGGWIRINNVRWYPKRDESKSSPTHLQRVKDALKNSEIQDGIRYILSGGLCVAIGFIYKLLVQIFPFSAWVILVVTFLMLFLFLKRNKKLLDKHLHKLTDKSDLYVGPHGLITYDDNDKSLQRANLQPGTNAMPQLPGQYSVTSNQVLEYRGKKPFLRSRLGALGLTICIAGIWMLHRYKQIN